MLLQVDRASVLKSCSRCYWLWQGTDSPPFKLLTDADAGSNSRSIHPTRLLGLLSPWPATALAPAVDALAELQTHSAIPLLTNVNLSLAEDSGRKRHRHRWGLPSKGDKAD